ncbi:MAG: TatD family hydrolase [Caldilineaceae bacterium]
MTINVALVDSHCHLDLEEFDTDRLDVLARADAAHVRLIINPGIDLQHCRQALALAEQHPQVYTAVGIHPNSSADFTSATLDELRELAKHPKVVAIGEIGLDYYWKLVEPEQQKRAFTAQLHLAAELGYPVIIHCREANQDVMAILQEWADAPITRHSPLATRQFWGVLHAFPGNWEMAQQAYGLNFVLGLGGPVTYKNARQLHELVPLLQLDRLMLETDAPYLTPHPYRGKRNEPGYVKLVCEQIATLTQKSVEEVAQRTTAVATRFFDLEAVLGGDCSSNTQPIALAE